MSHRPLKVILFPAVILFTFILSIFLLFTYNREERHFTEITSELFKSELLPNTLNMHYTLAFPSNYGIHSYEPTLPVYSPDEEVQGIARLENFLFSLEQINPHKLNEQDSYAWSLLTSYLSHQKEGAAFSFYEEPLSPSSGMHTQLAILLAEYTFRSKRDVTDYLQLLDQTDEYFNGLILYEQLKSEKGLFMPSYSANKVIEQCASILTTEELNAGTHFLQTTFSERLSQLVADKKINSKEKAYYETLNNKLLTSVMAPAYETLGDALFLLKDSGTNSQGLAHYPDGKTYYTYLLGQSTGCYDSMDDIKKMLYPKFDEEYKALQDLLQANPQAVAQLNTHLNPSLFPLSEPYSILEDLKKKMCADFPSLSSKEAPACVVKTISKNLEDYSAPAFYLTPPLDDTSSNVIYINQQSTPSGLELYTTLAHEGYPGHLYQSVYSQGLMQEKEVNPVRQLLWYGGYQEGWALYVEFLAFDYASQIMEEASLPQSAYAYEIEKHNRNMQLCLYSILDIAIHYDGASLEQVGDILSSFGITEVTTHQAIYEYIVEEPTNYLKYYLGYLQILSLKENAMSIWGDEYSNLRFHEFLLNLGPSDFTNLREQLQKTELSVPKA